MKTLTGRHVLLMFVSGFGIIIAVNAALAVNAVRTFPGLEVPNSYIASQTFQARLEAQQALGWTADATYREGQLRLTLTDTNGGPVSARDLRDCERDQFWCEDALFVCSVGLLMRIRCGNARVQLQARGELSDGGMVKDNGA